MERGRSSSVESEGGESGGLTPEEDRAWAEFVRMEMELLAFRAANHSKRQFAQAVLELSGQQFPGSLEVSDESLDLGIRSQSSKDITSIWFRGARYPKVPNFPKS